MVPMSYTNKQNKTMGIIQKISNKFGIDKIYHFSACFIITFITGLLLFPFANLAGILIGAFISSSCAALAKEYGDKCSPVNKWDWKDVIADYCGTFLAILLLLIIYVVL